VNKITESNIYFKGSNVAWLVKMFDGVKVWQIAKSRLWLAKNSNPWLAGT